MLLKEDRWKLNRRLTDARPSQSDVISLIGVMSVRSEVTDGWRYVYFGECSAHMVWPVHQGCRASNLGSKEVVEEGDTRQRTDQSQHPSQQ